MKTKVEDEQRSFYFHEQEIWWCSIGLNVGREEDGKNELFHRPVIILLKFSSELFWALPVSSKHKQGKYYLSFTFFKRKQTALLSQLRVLSSKRLIRCIGKLSDPQYESLLVAVQTLFTKRIPPPNN